MKKTMIITAVLAALLGISLLTGYNNLVTMNEGVNGKWSQVENQLQRRSDLIPNLVGTVKGFAAQEKAVIDSVTNARAKLAGAQGPADKAAANNELSSSLTRLLVVVENYPQLKSDRTFVGLMDELSGTENRLTVSRRDYNETVQGYNTVVQTFPTRIFAGALGFKQREYFRAEEGAKQLPKVTF